MCVKVAGEHIRKAPLNVNFGLEDNAQELRESWSNTQIPDVLLTIVASLFNINQTILITEIFEEGNTTPFDEEEDDYSESSSD